MVELVETTRKNNATTGVTVILGRFVLIAASPETLVHAAKLILHVFSYERQTLIFGNCAVSIPGENNEKHIILKVR